MVGPELGLGKAIVGAIARNIINTGMQQISERLTVTEIEKALVIAIDAAQKQVGELVPSLNADRRDQFETQVLPLFLGSGIGLEELQKPLLQSEKPDCAVLVTAFEQVAPQHIQESASELLQDWMRCFVDVYFEQTNTFIRFRAKQQKYLQRLITSCEDVKFVGIDVAARENHRAARLLDIFVVPNVTEETTTQPNRLDLLMRERPEQLTDPQAELWLEQRQRFEQERGRSLSAHQMLGGQRQRVVLLGDPGIGKTTLMRYLAVKTARGEGAEVGLSSEQERFPILVYMRDWAKHPERSLLEQVRDFAEQTLQMEVPTGFLEHWTDGQALLLLDGLDEVADDATRAALVEKINCFWAAHDGNWAVITSRPWGYRRDYFRTDAYPHFELELFDGRQIETFIEHWYTNRCETDAEAQAMIQDLQEALRSKDRLQNLVKNPLLLTMVALIHRYQDTLPKRRHKLYDRAVDTLLKSWDRKGKGEIYGEFKYLDRDDDLRRVISQLARWIHSQYETETTESGTLIDEADLLGQLSQVIQHECPQVKPHQARGEAERFVAFIRDRAGLINEYGQGRYAFVHKTFQEYLTAEAILQEAEYEDDSEVIYRAIREHLHNPHWREVLLLLVGQLKGKKAAKAINLVLQRKSEYEQWLHRDLLFAGRCLTEDPEQLVTAAPDLNSKIVPHLINLEIASESHLGEKTKQETSEILCWLKESAFETTTLNQLKVVQDQINPLRFLYLQALLGEKETARLSLLTLLNDDDSDVRYRAARTLVQLGDRSEAVLQGLLDLLKDEKQLVRSQAAQTFGQLGKSDVSTQSMLVSWIEENGNYQHLGSVLDALWQMCT